MYQEEIDILIRSSDVITIVQALIISGLYSLCQNPSTDPTMINHTSIRDIWLKSNHEDPIFSYLRLWPDTLYNLSVDCAKIEIPDIMSKDCFLLEEEYYRDPHARFGPRRASLFPELQLPILQWRSRLLRPDIPLFIPNIEAHLNALLTQERLERETGKRNGNFPLRHVSLFIRYLYFDWKPAGDWLLETKIHDCNGELMRSKLDRYSRGRGKYLWDGELEQWVAGKIPWELGVKKVGSS
ncbi:MAG: hypothetical protein Q9168_003561 [Polycauliona sp. 1 TL-2023]